MEKKSRTGERSDSLQYERGGIAFVGFIMLGLAFGILYNQTAVGILAGLGLGFISMAILAKNK
jgi:hypothetical protein